MMLSREGGDRYAAGDWLLPAVAASLALADDDEIRAAFGMGAWRAVTEAHRARYGEYFAPKVARAVGAEMVAGLNTGRLAIKDFAIFEKPGFGDGELFPIADGWPVRESDMVLVDVTIAPGPDDDLTVRDSYEGRWERWRDGVAGNVVEGFCEEYAGLAWGVHPTDQEFFVVPVRRSLVLDYGGLLERTLNVVGGLVVRGYVSEVHYNPESPNSYRYDLQVTDKAPAFSGLVPFSPVADLGFGGPFQAWEYVRAPAEFWGAVYSASYVEAFAGRLAEGVLSAGAVHRLEWGDVPLEAGAWVNCFPRTKWIAGFDVTVGGEPSRVYHPVEWLSRRDWMFRFEHHLAALVADGRAVPAGLVGERMPPGRVYAKFAPSFLADLNDEPLPV